MSKLKPVLILLVLIQFAIDVFPHSFPMNITPDVTSNFGEYRSGSWLHSGIDLGTGGSENKLVKTVTPGQVAYVGDSGSQGLGKYIIIAHPDKQNKEYYSLYAHLNSTNVVIDQIITVTQYENGYEIGKSGNTGSSDGAHLHFAIHKLIASGSPQDFLNPLENNLTGYDLEINGHLGERPSKGSFNGSKYDNLSVVQSGEDKHIIFINRGKITPPSVGGEVDLVFEAYDLIRINDNNGNIYQIEAVITQEEEPQAITTLVSIMDGWYDTKTNSDKVKARYSTKGRVTSSSPSHYFHRLPWKTTNFADGFYQIKIKLYDQECIYDSSSNQPTLSPENDGFYRIFLDNTPLKINSLIHELNNDWLTVNVVYDATFVVPPTFKYEGKDIAMQELKSHKRVMRKAGDDGYDTWQVTVEIAPAAYKGEVREGTVEAYDDAGNVTSKTFSYEPPPDLKDYQDIDATNSLYANALGKGINASLLAGSNGNIWQNAFGLPNDYKLNGKTLDQWLLYYASDIDETDGNLASRRTHSYNPYYINDIAGWPPADTAAKNTEDFIQSTYDLYKSYLESNTDDDLKNMLASLGSAQHFMLESSIPAHTRNNPYDPSHITNEGIGDHYEHFVRNVTPDTMKAITPLVNPVVVDKFKDLWDKETYKSGASVPSYNNTYSLAEYVNGNFPSDFTMDVINDPNADKTYYNYPLSSELTDTTLDNKKYKKRGAINKFLAVSAFDNGTISALFVDDECSKDYAVDLFPKAADYSAGLLNYFFRGQFGEFATTSAPYTQESPTKSYLYYLNNNVIRLRIPNTSANGTNTYTMNNFFTNEERFDSSKVEVLYNNEPVNITIPDEHQTHPDDFPSGDTLFFEFTSPNDNFDINNNTDRLVLYFDGNLELTTVNPVVAERGIASLVLTSLVDNTLPYTPESVGAAAGEGIITLSWAYPHKSPDFVGCHIYRIGDGENDYTHIDDDDYSPYQDLTVVGNTSYTYLIRAYDYAGNLSLSSNLANAIPLTASIQLSGIQAGYGIIKLSWSDVGSDDYVVKMGVSSPENPIATTKDLFLYYKPDDTSSKKYKIFYGATQYSNTLDLAATKSLSDLPAPGSTYATYSNVATPKGIDVTPDGNYAFVALYGADAVFQIDLHTSDTTLINLTDLFDTTWTGSGPSDVAISKDGKTVYVACMGNNNIAWFDIENPTSSSDSISTFDSSWTITPTKLAVLDSPVGVKDKLLVSEWGYDLGVCDINEDNSLNLTSDSTITLAVWGDVVAAPPDEAESFVVSHYYYDYYDSGLYASKYESDPVEKWVTVPTPVDNPPIYDQFNRGINYMSNDKGFVARITPDKLQNWADTTDDVGLGGRSVNWIDSHPSEEYIAITSSDDVKLWKVGDGTLPTESFGSQGAYDVAFSPDGKKLIVSNYWDDKVTVYSPSSGGGGGQKLAAGGFGGGRGSREPVETGTLTIHTNVSLVRVYIDGIEINPKWLQSRLGEIPIILAGLPIGIHEVEVIMPCYSSYKATVEIGADTEITAFLAPKIATTYQPYEPDKIKIKRIKDHRRKPKVKDIQALSALGSFSTLSWIDWNNDGEMDLITGDTLGNVSASGKKLNVNVGGEAEPLAWDWNRDGRKDLLVGDRNGYINLYLNSGSDKQPIFGESTFIKDKSGYSIYDASGYVKPYVVDANRDDLPDLLTLNGSGQLTLYLSEMVDGVYALGTAQPITIADPDLFEGDITDVDILDINHNGLNDLVITTKYGEIKYYVDAAGK